MIANRANLVKIGGWPGKAHTPEERFYNAKSNREPPEKQPPGAFS